MITVRQGGLEPLGQGGPGHETKVDLAGGIAAPREKTK
jgi:hypothetical protein